MDVLLIGSGGREHALAVALQRDPDVGVLHVAPGNPGLASAGTPHPVAATDPSAVAGLAAELGVDLVVVGPEAPLVAGVADAVRARGIRCFGPSAAAARIEGSKAYAKDVMSAAGVPTARSFTCTSADEVERALAELSELSGLGGPYVVKDDGLASGKGVLVTDDRAAALAHAAACERVVVEEFLDGPEVSLFAITDGTIVLPLQPAQDFKRLADGDTGPNTGGMGAYAPLDWLPSRTVDEVVADVVQPTVDELRKRGTPFVGLLYTGLALTSTGIRVVEFNARFGDPETQSLLALLETPLAGVLDAAASGSLADVALLRWSSGAAVTVVLAAAGYPEVTRKGDPITGIAEADALEGVDVLHAGTALSGSGQLVTAGGRVLAVTAAGPDLPTARARAYDGIGRIEFAGSQHRTDIASPGREPTI